MFVGFAHPRNLRRENVGANASRGVIHTERSVVAVVICRDELGGSEQCVGIRAYNRKT
jgi:hypothetical protein